MKPDNNTVALFCLTLIIIFAIFYRVENVKDIVLALGGAIAGWMAKRSTE